ISAGFIPGPNALGATSALALDGSNHLFVLDLNGRVGQYDATTGATINETFLPRSGTSTHYGLAYLDSVPEPSSLLAVAAGGAAIAAMRRRKRVAAVGRIALLLGMIVAAAFTARPAQANVLLVSNSQSNVIGAYDGAT